jgi:CRP-like cAMP-binding protein
MSAGETRGRADANFAPAMRVHRSPSHSGLTEGNRYELPTTQEQLGDATGLTAVHVNRTLQGLRTAGLISSDKRTITIEDWKALTAVGDFDMAYLHPEIAQGSPP